MTRRTVARSRHHAKDFCNLSIEEKLSLMDQLYQRVVEDGSLGEIVVRGRKVLKKSGVGGNSSENGYFQIPSTVVN